MSFLISTPNYLLGYPRTAELCAARGSVVIAYRWLVPDADRFADLTLHE